MLVDCRLIFIDASSSSLLEQVFDISTETQRRAMLVLSKILETVLGLLKRSDQSDDYQFGFRKKHSTALCTAVFKRTVKYYTERGSHV